jgi:hypothetical protein
MYQYFQYAVLCKYHKLLTERLRYLQRKKKDVIKPIISLFTIKTKSAGTAHYHALQGKNTEHLTQQQ